MHKVSQKRNETKKWLDLGAYRPFLQQRGGWASGDDTSYGGEINGEIWGS